MRFAAKAAIPLIIGGLTMAAVACSSPAPTPAEPPEPSMVKVLAPIESVNVIVAESFPPQYFLLVKSGLPNGCVKFDSYEVTREDDTIRVTVTNLEPADKDTICTQVYGTVDSNIPLGSDFEPGKTYTVLVNDVTKTFVAQGPAPVSGEIPATLGSPVQLKVGQAAFVEPQGPRVEFIGVVEDSRCSGRLRGSGGI